MSHYYQASEAQNALSVVARWMAESYNLKINYHNGTAVNADVFNGIINIPKLSLASGLDQDALTLLRGQIYHEAGHIFDRIALQSIKEQGRYPSGILFQIWNAVEDMRMERSVCERYMGAKQIFNWNSNYHNQKIAEKVAEGQELGAIWESLVAMMFQSDSKPPKWRLSDKAQKYFDAAYNTFCKWKQTVTPLDTLDLAEEIFEILKETHEEDKQEQQQQNQQNDDQQDQDDNEEQEGEGQSEDNQDGENDDSDDNSPQQSGSGDFDDEEENDENNQNNSDSGSDDNSEESDGSDSDSSDSGSDNQSDSSDDSESDDGEDSDEQSNSDSSENSDEIGKTDDNPQLTEQATKTLEDIIREMEEQLDGFSLKELQDEDIEKALNNLDIEDTEYLSDKSNDIHKEIEPNKAHSSAYQKTRKKVSAAVASMTSGLQQALLARAECQKVTCQRRGKIDTRRLPHLIKGLSKNVFYQVEDGEEINTAVEIIIDESSSMGYRDMYLSVRQIALAIAEVLTQLDIPFEITGTTTVTGGNESDVVDRYKPIVYKHYKTFNQNWNVVKNSIMQTGHHQNNVDGEAVEYCVNRLQERPETRKIVLSLSDGEPWNGQTPQEKLERHLIRTCEQARKNGVEVYGFGVGTYAPEKFYGEENFIYLDRDKIDTSFTKAFVDIVTGGRIF